MKSSKAYTAGHYRQSSAPVYLVAAIVGVYLGSAAFKKFESPEGKPPAKATFAERVTRPPAPEVVSR